MKIFKALIFSALLIPSIAHAQTEPIVLTFVDHLKAGFVEQDVFVEKLDGSCDVYRVTAEEREKYLESELFTTQEMQYHDPLNRENVGPFRKGQSLGITLRDWLSAKGTVNYKCEDGWGVLKAEFENLVPNGTYTMWHFFMAKPSNEPLPFPGTLDVPLGNRNGSQSVFTADENGKAVFERRFETCLQLTGIQTMGALAIAYHSDGKTYGVLPGPFGQVTHVHMFAVLPDVNDVEN